jgi:hypothetical protein
VLAKTVGGELGIPPCLFPRQVSGVKRRCGTKRSIAEHVLPLIIWDLAPVKRR